MRTYGQGSYRELPATTPRASSQATRWKVGLRAQQVGVIIGEV